MARLALGKELLRARVPPWVITWWHSQALRHGFKFGDGPALGEFLEAIARGDFEIVCTSQDNCATVIPERGNQSHAAAASAVGEQTLTYQEFIAIVSADLGREYQPDMIDGFKDYSAEPGATTQGFSFNLPTASRCYSWAKHEKWYYSSIGGSGFGESLEEAIAQSQIPVDEDEAA